MSAERPSFESIAQKPIRDILDANKGKIRAHYPVVNPLGHVVWLDESSGGAGIMANGMNVGKEYTMYTVDPYLEEGDTYTKGAHWTDGGAHEVTHGVPAPEGDGYHGKKRGSAT